MIERRHCGRALASAWARGRVVYRACLLPCALQGVHGRSLPVWPDFIDQVMACTGAGESTHRQN